MNTISGKNSYLNVPSIIVFTDPGKDPDDTLALFLLTQLEDKGMCDILYIVSTLGNPSTRTMRSRHIKWLLERSTSNPKKVRTGLSYSYKTSEKEVHNVMLQSAPISKDVELIPDFNIVELENDLKTKNDRSVILVSISGLSDVSRILTDIPSNLLIKLNRVVIMGGIKESDFKQSQGTFESFNLQTDPIATKTVLDLSRFHNIPITSVDKGFVYRYPITFRDLDRLEHRNYQIGSAIKKMYQESFSRLWSQIASGLYKGRDKAWFVSTFTNSKFDDLDELKFDKVSSGISKIMLYDPITILMSLPLVLYHISPELSVKERKGESIFINDMSKVSKNVIYRLLKEHLLLELKRSPI